MSLELRAGQCRRGFLLERDCVRPNPQPIAEAEGNDLTAEDLLLAHDTAIEANVFQLELFALYANNGVLARNERAGQDDIASGITAD